MHNKPELRWFLEAGLSRGIIHEKGLQKKGTERTEPTAAPSPVPPQWCWFFWFSLTVPPRPQVCILRPVLTLFLEPISYKRSSDRKPS